MHFTGNFPCVRNTTDDCCLCLISDIQYYVFYLAVFFVLHGTRVEDRHSSCYFLQSKTLPGNKMFNSYVALAKYFAMISGIRKFYFPRV
jgi:hypothetical protein